MGFQTEATTIKMEKSGIRTIKQKKIRSLYNKQNTPMGYKQNEIPKRTTLTIMITPEAIEPCLKKDKTYKEM